MGKLWLLLVNEKYLKMDNCLLYWTTVIKNGQDSRIFYPKP